jgi:DNA replication protein DnaC
MDTPRVLLEHYLKQLRLPTVLREFPKLAEQCTKEGTTFEQFLLRLVEQEMLDRERRATERRIATAKFLLVARTLPFLINSSKIGIVHIDKVNRFTALKPIRDVPSSPHGCR